MNRAINTAPTEHHLIRRVDDGIYRKRRYITLDYLHRFSYRFLLSKLRANMKSGSKSLFLTYLSFNFQPTVQFLTFKEAISLQELRGDLRRALDRLRRAFPEDA